MASSIPYDDDNVFKKIIDGVIPCYKIFETEHALAFLDAFPMAPGHALLVPKTTGCATMMDLPEDVAANVLKELPRLARAVKAATGCDGVNVVQNNGATAGQVVFHLHVHVIPRWEKDGVVRLGKSGEAIGKDAADAMVAKMKAAIRCTKSAYSRSARFSGDMLVLRPVIIPIAHRQETTYLSHRLLYSINMAPSSYTRSQPCSVPPLEET